MSGADIQPPATAEGRSARLFTLPAICNLADADYQRFLAWVSTPCRERVLRFMRYEDRCRGVAGEALCRYAVYRYDGGYRQPWLTEKNEFGKPYLPGTGVHFNLSHSGNWVVCAVDREEVGTDVEITRSVDPAIAVRFFSAPERELLEQCDSIDEERKLFLGIWTLKESYIKAIGRGLDCPLDSFACLPEATGIRLIRYDQRLPHAFFHHLMLDDEHRCSVCCLAECTGIKRTGVSVDELIAFIAREFR
jgi:4'-phosphopantetheinyl transferase